MHSDGIDPAPAGAGGRPDPHLYACTTCPPDERREAASGPRVVGLGAPVSVRIRLASCELALLRRQLLRQRDAAALPARSWHTTSMETPEPWPEAERTWAHMLAELDVPEGEGAFVLWPTAYAAPVLRGALAEALDIVTRGHGGGDADLGSLADALTTAQVLLETVRAFLAVDRGGLQEVWL